MQTAELDVGALLAGRYRVTALLGTGGMSRVFLARDESLGRDVAVKIFPSSLLGDEDAARRRDEVTLLAAMGHPGLVVLYDASLDSHPAFLTMEYVAGETLAQRMARGPLDPAEAAEILGSVCEALAFVHAGGVVHRDVKPANILLPESPTLPRAKLADFGIARLLESDSVTAAGTVMGTAAYLSPEQASGRPAGPASDVYALGIVLIEALTGRRPFPGTAIESAAARLSRDPDLEAGELAPYRSLLQRMTARNPRDRPTAAEVAADLAGGAVTRGMAAPDAPTAPVHALPVHPLSVARRRGGRAWAFGIAGALLVACTVAVGVTGLLRMPALGAEIAPTTKVMPVGTTVDAPVVEQPATAPGNTGNNGNGNGGKKDKAPKNGKG